MTTPLPPTDPPRSDEPLPGEAELTALYRELPRSEPSPALDAAVLRAAAVALAAAGDPTGTERRRAPREAGDWVHPKPVSATTAKAIPSIEAASRRRHAPRWLITLGSAASLVLVAGLAWQLRESSPPPAAPVAAQNAITPAASEMAKTSHEEAAPRAGAASPAPVTQPAPQLANQQAAAAKKVKQNSALQSARREAAAKPMAAPPAVAELAAPAPLVHYAPPPPPAPPAPPAPLQEVSGNAVASGMLDKADQPAPPSASKSAAAPMATNAATSDQDTASQPGDTPAQELDKIRQLFAQGHHDEALQRLRAFRQSHPQWPLTPALQAQLQEP